MYFVVSECEKTYRTGRAGDLGAGIAQKLFFQKPSLQAFPTAADPADRAVGPLSPLPRHAWHGYGVFSAHHREVRGCRRACERTPLRGRRRRAPQLCKHVENLVSSSLPACCPDTTCTEPRIEACITCTCTNIGPQNMGRKSNVCAHNNLGGPMIKVPTSVNNAPWCTLLENHYSTPKSSCMAIEAGPGG
jgi:hypothetical protein